MEIRQYFFIIQRWLWLIILGAILAGTTTFLVNQAQEPVYRATSKLLINEGNGSGGRDEYTALLTSERLALSYVERLKNREVLQEVIDNLALNMTVNRLGRSIQVTLIGQTQLVALSAEHTDPQTAALIANEIPAVFARRNLEQQSQRFSTSKESLAGELSEIEQELLAAETTVEQELAKENPEQVAIDQANDNLIRLRETYSRLLQSYEDVRVAEAGSLSNVIIDERATPPIRPISPRTLNNTILAAIAGMMLMTGIAFVIEYLDDTIKSPHDVERTAGLSTIGGIELLKINNRNEGLIVAKAPRSPAAEAYRQIRTNIQFIDVDNQAKTLLITSANPSEGKTTVTANLAAALAQSGKRVIIVDCDMRRPALSEFMEVNSSRGLSDMIIRGRHDPGFIKGTMVPNLRLLPAGRLPPNPAELLGSERMRDLVAWLSQQADYVVFDSPPILAVTDAAVLSQLVDVTLFVASAGETRSPAMIDAMKRMQAVDSKLAGVILNKVPATGRWGAYTYYYRINYEPHSMTEAAPSWRKRLQTSLGGLFN
ncbi:MAG: polysaccharide biosynthesis tyrosine autokinase [Chloroflexota bacterium]